MMMLTMVNNNFMSKLTTFVDIRDMQMIVRDLTNMIRSQGNNNFFKLTVLVDKTNTKKITWIWEATNNMIRSMVERLQITLKIKAE
jgi:hypothetical protein